MRGWAKKGNLLEAKQQGAKFVFDRMGYVIKHWKKINNWAVDMEWSGFIPTSKDVMIDMTCIT